ncbi:MAG: response regulator [Bdellovibrionales bacterium]
MAPRLQKIMCIDDEPDILDIVKICLEAGGGYEVVTCSSGKEVLDQIGDIKPDLVLLDILIPAMDGVTIFGKLRGYSSLKAVPIIFITAMVQPKEVSTYIEIGAAGVIMKPFDPMKLPAEVESLWKSFHDRQ